MHSLTVTYPVAADTHFDFDYYRNTHMPLCARLFGPHGYRGFALRVDQGSAPGEGGLNYVSIDLLFESRAHLAAALAAAGEEVTKDIPNYTNSTPSMVFGEIEVDLS